MSALGRTGGWLVSPRRDRIVCFWKTLAATAVSPLMTLTMMSLVKAGFSISGIHP